MILDWFRRSESLASLAAGSINTTQKLLVSNTVLESGALFYWGILGQGACLAKLLEIMGDSDLMNQLL